MHRRPDKVQVSPAAKCFLTYYGGQSFAVHRTCWTLLQAENLNSLWNLALTTEMTGKGRPQFVRNAVRESLLHAIWEFSRNSVAETHTPLAKLIIDLVQIPPELQSLILQSLGQCYFQRAATVLHQAIPFARDLSTSRDLHTFLPNDTREERLDARESDIYIRWSRLAGQRYISEISTSPTSDQSCRLKAKGATAIMTIDYL